MRPIAMKVLNRNEEKREATRGILAEYLSGLRRRPKRLSSKLFYDDEGSRLFARICELDDYYPTRTEQSLLRRHAAEIAELAGERVSLVELGSGEDGKVRILLGSLRRPVIYIPVDISGEQLERSCRRLCADFVGLRIRPVCGDYTKGIVLPPFPAESERTLIFFPGSSLGNFEPIEALEFLLRLTRLGGEGTGLLIGIDLKKEEAVLNAAYNDPTGVTAAFNLNILARANREFSAGFDLNQFRHRAFYDASYGRVVMQLESLCSQDVRMAGERVSFERGERVTTEYSYKYSVEEFQALARLAGFIPRAVWTDQDEWFSLHYLKAK